MPELVVRVDDLGGLEAMARLVDEGILQPVRDGYAAPASIRVTPEVRAASLADHVSPRAIVVGEAAAWVHAGGAPPDDIEVRYRSAHFRLGS